jgi:hypothetical protein
VAKFNQVTRLVDFALESTQRALNGLAITYADFDLDIQLSRTRGCEKETGKA